MQAIRHIADRNGLHVIPHGWNSGVGLAADLQFQSTVADERFCMVEVWPHWTVLDLFKGQPFSLDGDGRITVPSGPGLGVELKDEIRS